jgi:hypothetical protein
MLLQGAFPARRGTFLSRIFLTFIGVPSGRDNCRPLRPYLDQENQLPELRRFAQAHGYTVYKEYVEHESGGTGKRSKFQALFADVHLRRFDLVLF